MTGDRPGSPTPRDVTRVWCVTGAVLIAMAWGYLSAVFLLDRGPFGSLWWYVAALIAGFLAYGFLMGGVRRQRIGLERVKSVTLFTGVSLLCILAADTAFSIYLNLSRSPAESFDVRHGDAQVWVSELYPKLYYPTDRNFRLLKPGVRVRGSTYGALYRTPMLESTTLSDSVLEMTDLTIAINDLGFRESSALGEAEIFVLSDSFGFGWGVDEEEGWPGLLEASLGRPVYNLSVSDASPLQELELLEHVLRAHGDSAGVRHLLWMIYEGNDLEDDYSDKSPGAAGKMAARSDAIRGTVFHAVRNLPRAIRGQSIVHKFRSGQARLRPANPVDAVGIREIDGVALPEPLFRSDRLGLRLFYGMYVERAQQPEDYVTGHPNWPRLQRVFTRMGSLAEQFDFKVTVLLVPTAARLHGPYFDGFPALSSHAHFLDLVAGLSESNGFETVNLYELMKPYAGAELLYFRDDDHLNRRGHRVVAQLIQESALPSDP